LLKAAPIAPLILLGILHYSRKLFHHENLFFHDGLLAIVTVTRSDFSICKEFSISFDGGRRVANLSPKQHMKTAKEGSLQQQGVSLREFLDIQTKTCGVLMTVEPVEEKPEVVKLTPQPGGVCMCGLGIEVPKAAISNVIPTGDTVRCCGKVLRAVEVTFAEGASISLKDLFGQLSAGFRRAQRRDLWGYGIVPFEAINCVQLHKKVLAETGDAELAKEAFRECVAWGGRR
jgi:hypothetical protein